MALFGLFGVLTLVTVASLWVIMRLVHYQLQTGEEASDALQWTASVVLPVWKGTVALVAVLEVWPGLASWASGAYGTVVSFA